MRTARLAAVSFSIRSWVISRVTLSKTTGASTACSAGSLPVDLSSFFLMRPPIWAWAVPHEIRRMTAGSHRKEVLTIMMRSSRDLYEEGAGRDTPASDNLLQAGGLDQTSLVSGTAP